MTKDLIKTPSHYGDFVIQPIVFIMSNNFSFWRGNVIKYACRAGSKVYDGQTKAESEITDLKKAMRYCEMRINQLEGRGITNG